MEKSIMLGILDAAWAPSLAELAREISPALGHDLVEVDGGTMFHGGTDRTHAWLTRDHATNEPFVSHPFDLELSVPHEPEEPFMHDLFDRLKEQNRYRLILVLDHACARSTHFSCSDW
ncbi:hypothetical protein KOI35_41670 [Actinoplanes bogorensis]|uniref:Uncharacterized protein n=1 Tax=Paractinoplanes bogorensis TaxID=1610840 RepID=A0ABS5Z2V7_9ACTN|nr:hypothetical protein [Actinoplanes bogorensis]MBU2670034.1 hypothetical protein [Actinoplanes bogorensis]